MKYVIYQLELKLIKKKIQFITILLEHIKQFHVVFRVFF